MLLMKMTVQKMIQTIILRKTDLQRIFISKNFKLNRFNPYFCDIFVAKV